MTSSSTPYAQGGLHRVDTFNHAAMKLFHSRSITARSLSTVRLPCTVANRSCPFDAKVAIARCPRPEPAFARSSCLSR